MAFQVYVKALEQVTLIYPHLGVFGVADFGPVIHDEQDVFIDGFHVQGFVIGMH